VGTKEEDHPGKMAISLKRCGKSSLRKYRRTRREVRGLCSKFVCETPEIWFVIPKRVLSHGKKEGTGGASLSSIKEPPDKNLTTRTPKKNVAVCLRTEKGKIRIKPRT